MEEKKHLREGLTTGTCAAAAAMASAIWQMKGSCPETVCVELPIGRQVYLDVMTLDYPSCAVIKDAGDDPDVTNGCKVCACVALSVSDGEITFEGGEGIGKVTLPGLKLPVGEPAINPVPRQMIADHVRKVIGKRAARVTVFVPGGDVLALKTFNPRLGVMGGISILGTTGIVRPMSEDALKESLSAELSVRLAATKHIALVPGGAGEDALRAHFKENVACVQMSNYVGYVLDEAVRMGAESLLVAGPVGKLVKVAADIMNTHSHVADGRREVVCTYAALNGAPTEVICEIFEAKTLRQTVDILEKYQLSYLWDQIAEAACEKCRLRTMKKIPIGLILFDHEQRIIGKSSQLDDVLRLMGIELNQYYKR